MKQLKNKQRPGWSGNLSRRALGLMLGLMCGVLWNSPALALPAVPVAAQGKVNVSAQLSTGLARKGEVAHIRIAVENAESARIVALPTIEGVNVGPVGPPVPSGYTAFVGGRMKTVTTLQWRIPLEAIKVGEFNIPPVKMEIDGQPVDLRISPATFKVVGDLDKEKLGVFEIPDRPERIYEGQPFPMRLRLGWADALQIEKVNVILPWWRTLPGVLEVVGPGFNNRSVNTEILYINNQESPFERLGVQEVGGDSFVMYEKSTTWVATRSGTLEFPTSSFVFAERIERASSPFRRGRMREYYLTLDPFEIEVLPVPEEGRPFEWTGAVGTLVAERRVDRRDVTAGDTIKLDVTWSGLANTEFFDLPDLKRIEAFEGFHVLGVEDTHLGMERRAVYELVPLTHEVTEIPPVPLWLFNTDTDAYEELRTDPVEIRVSEGDDLDLTAAFGESEDEGAKRDLADLHRPIAITESSGEPRAIWILGALALTLIGWLVLRRAVRVHGDPASARSKARRKAMRNLQQQLRAANSPGESARAVQTFLGVRSDESAEAWIGRDLVAWVNERKPEPAALEKAKRLHAILEGMDAATFAGDAAAAPDSQTVVQAVRDLQSEGVL